VRLYVCGVRGSTPAPGPEFVRYGGNTSCVAIARDGEAPALVLDAGTGLTRLSQVLDGRPFRGSILLGHLHWDHTHGLPFFRAGDHPDAQVHLYMPAQGDPVAVLARALSPPHFPIEPTQLRGSWRFHALEPGDHAIEGFTVQAREIPHKGGRTFGYRVSGGSASGGGATITYLSDHSPITLGPGPEGLGEYHDVALELARDADVLLHDAQYTADELAARAEFGHSAIDYAVRLAERAGVRRLLLFHHDPPRTDDAVDELARAARQVAGPTGLDVTAAAEGMVVDV
jgi:phosphoribosyl 1,2-cyclic phosphodiesterase